MADLSDLRARDLPAPSGHNNPPDLNTPEWIQEDLALRYTHSVSSAREHVSVVNNMPATFTAENEAEYVTDLIRLMAKSQQHLEGLRKKEKQPHWDRGVAVDSFFNEWKTALQAAIDKAEKPLKIWLEKKAEAERRERQDAVRMISEQQQQALKDATVDGTGIITHGTMLTSADALNKVISTQESLAVAQTMAAAPVHSMARTLGTTTSAQAGLKKAWVGVITNVDEVDLNKLRPYISKKELDAALVRFVKAGHRICGGCDIKEITETMVK